MSRENYSEALRLKCQQLYIEESKTPRSIALLMNGKPSWQTITRWAKVGNWEQARREWQHRRILELSPKSIEEKIMSKILDVLDSDDKDNNMADSIAKLQSTLAKIAPQKSQIPALFAMLEEFLKFIQKHRPDLLTPDLIRVSKDFKDSQLTLHGLNSV